MVTGQHHFVTARYLYQYAAEAARKEDNRRLPNGEAFTRTIGLTMASPVSRTWKGTGSVMRLSLSLGTRMQFGKGTLMAGQESCAARIG